MKVTYTVDVVGELWQPGYNCTATRHIRDRGVRTDNAQVGAADEVVQVVIIVSSQLGDFSLVNHWRITRTEVEEVDGGVGADGFHITFVRTRRTVLRDFSPEGEELFGELYEAVGGR